MLYKYSIEVVPTPTAPKFACPPTTKAPLTALVTYSLVVLIPSLPINPVFASASKSTCGSAVPIPILVPAPTLEFTYTFPKVLTPALLTLAAVSYTHLRAHET